jgi:transcriptional regulator with XRE-family HTH domain
MVLVVPLCQVVKYNSYMSQPRKKPQDSIDEMALNIAENLKAARKKQGLTQAELAELIGVTREAITAYESGRVRLMDDILIRFSSVLKISTDEILGVKKSSSDIPVVSLRLMKRLQKIERLPAFDQKALLKTIDNALKGAGFNDID